MFKIIRSNKPTILNKVSASCKYLLDNFPEAQDVKSYLKSRITDESQNLFQFGYFPGIDNLNSLTDMVGEDALRKVGFLFSKDIEDSLCPRTINSLYFEDYPLILPFRDVYGKTVALIGRSLLPEKELKERKISKYKNTKFLKGNFLFGLYENKQCILEQNAVYIVEGQFDVIKAVERGFRNIVALSGSSMTPYQFSVISRYTNNMFLLLDNDEAGEKGRKLIVSRFGKLANIQNFYLPESYKDIDEYLTQNGNESVSFVVKA